MTGFGFARMQSYLTDIYTHRNSFADGLARTDGASVVQTFHTIPACDVCEIHSPTPGKMDNSGNNNCTSGGGWAFPAGSLTLWQEHSPTKIYQH